METELAATLAEIASETSELAGGGSYSHCHTGSMQPTSLPYHIETPSKLPREGRKLTGSMPMARCARRERAAARDE